MSHLYGALHWRQHHTAPLNMMPFCPIDEAERAMRETPAAQAWIEKAWFPAWIDGTTLANLKNDHGLTIEPGPQIGTCSILLYGEPVTQAIHRPATNHMAGYWKAPFRGREIVAGCAEALLLDILDIIEDSLRDNG